MNLGRGVARHASLLRQVANSRAPTRLIPRTTHPTSAPTSTTTNRTNLCLSTLAGGFTYPAPRKLDDIAKKALLAKQPSGRVREIWLEHHGSNKSAVADVLTRTQYETLMARAKRCPLFVLPVGREQGYFTLLLQFQGAQALCTFLEDYKRNAANAMPYLTVTFFDDFVDTKGIALVRADVTNQMSQTEGKVAWELVKRFYLGEGANSFDAVVAFNERPGTFQFNTVLKAAGIAA